MFVYNEAVRVFDNPNQLPGIVVSFRLGNKDNYGSIFNKLIVNQDNTVSYFIHIISDVYTDGQIEAALVDPLAQDESDYLSDSDANDQQMKEDYQAIITQLEAFEVAVAMTNEQAVQAINLLAGTTKNIMKFIRKQVL